jgi:hypothetical protein
MKNRIKLGLLGVAASAFLALPLAASAETPSRNGLLSETQRTDAIIQVPVIIEHNPPTYISEIDLHNPPMFREPIDFHNPPTYHNSPTYYIP